MPSATVVRGSITKISAELQVTVLATHHLGKENGKTMRGSGVFRADVDFVLFLERAGAKSGRQLRVDKVSSNLESWTRPFELVSVKLVGGDGRDIPAGVVRSFDAPAKAAKSAPKSAAHEAARLAA